jgi:hypothetical protein
VRPRPPLQALLPAAARGRRIGVLVGVLGAMTAGCGRTQLSPWATTAGDGGALRDGAAGGEGASEPPGDGAAPDGAAPDGALPDGGGDPSTLPLTCGALRALAGRGSLTTRHARQAMFTANGRALMLRVAGQASSADELLRVGLPGGEISTVATGVTGAEWLGSSGRVLATRAGGGALTVLTTDGTFVRALLAASCEHVTTPDGTRVYALRDCDGARGTGVLVAIDVETGQTTTLSAAAAQQTLVVSPDSRFAAYETVPVGADPGGIRVSDRRGADYPLVALAGARRPAFTPTGMLLFVTAASASPLAVADIYRHVPGTGASVLQVARSFNVGTGGYHVSPDGALLLAARFPPGSPMLNQLFAERLDGSGETLVASNLAPYQTNAAAGSAFAFSADGARVVFVSNNFSGTATVSVAGGLVSPLGSGGTFAISPRGDWVVVIEPMSATRALDTVRVLDAETGAQVAAFGASATQGLTFLPDGRAVLYVGHRTGEPQRLLQLNLPSASLSTLAEWTTSQYWTPHLASGELTPSDGYPIDPTGCYAVVDNDAGTSLVLLP